MGLKPSHILGSYVELNNSSSKAIKFRNTGTTFEVLPGYTASGYGCSVYTPKGLYIQPNKESNVILKEGLEFNSTPHKHGWIVTVKNCNKII